MNLFFFLSDTSFEENLFETTYTQGDLEIIDRSEKEYYLQSENQKTGIVYEVLTELKYLINIHSVKF